MHSVQIVFFKIYLPIVVFIFHILMPEVRVDMEKIQNDTTVLLGLASRTTFSKFRYRLLRALSPEYLFIFFIYSTMGGKNFSFIVLSCLLPRCAALNVLFLCFHRNRFCIPAINQISLSERKGWFPVTLHCRLEQYRSTSPLGLC